MTKVLTLTLFQEQDPFSDSDLESNVDGEIDYYSGESLLRENFSGDDEQRDKSKISWNHVLVLPFKDLSHFTEDFNKLKKTDDFIDDARKDGNLRARVFIEPLNSFLPKIEKNRIFPLRSFRYVDKKCSHLGDNQPRKRQAYVPPHSRTSGV